MLDDSVFMLLPGGVVLDDRDAILDGFAEAPPWAELRMEGARVGPLVDGDPAAPFRRPGGWRLAFHQQTPR